jgi:hypothetical protein
MVKSIEKINDLMGRLLQKGKRNQYQHTSVSEKGDDQAEFILCRAWKCQNFVPPIE